VLVDDAAVPDRAARASAADVDAGARRALVQVGLAVGLASGQAHHRHHRIALVDHGTDVRHALVGDLVEQRIEAHAVLDHGVIGLATEAVHAAEDVADVVLQPVQRDQAAAGFAEVVLVARLDDDDAFAAGAVRGLDHEIAVLAEQAVQRAGVVVGLDHAVERRHRNPGFDRELFGDQLVVHPRVEMARVAGRDVIAIAAIQPHDAERAQLGR
jgi:hypothetical protein